MGRRKSCPNCGEKFYAGSTSVDYMPDSRMDDGDDSDDGRGECYEGRMLCPLCKKGCYQWSRDDVPGFRESWKGPCCYCKKVNE